MPMPYYSLFLFCVVGEKEHVVIYFWGKEAPCAVGNSEIAWKKNKTCLKDKTRKLK